MIWKTPIPGAGYSSPIVNGDSVWVATAFDEESVFDKVDYLTMGLVLVVAAGAARFSAQLASTDGASIHKIATLAAFASLLTVLLTISVFGDVSLDYQRSEVRGWLASSVALSLALALSAFYLHRKSRWRATLIALSLGVMVLIATHRVSRSVLNNLELMNSKSLIVMITTGLPVMCTWLALKSTSARAASNLNSDRMTVTLRRTSLNLFWATLLTIALLASLTGIAMLAIGSSEYLAYQIRKPILEPTWGWSSVGALVVVSLGGLAWGVFPPSRFRSPNPASGRSLPAGFRLAAICLGIVVFTKTNFDATRLLPPMTIRALVCVDRANGRQRWICEGLRSASEKHHTYNSLATPTPLFDRDRVYTYFGTAGLFCANDAGQVLWRNQQLPYQTANGVGASPVLYGDRLIIVSDQPAAPYVAALDAGSGEILWKQDRTGNPDFGCGVSRTPVIKKIEDTTAVIVCGFNDVTAYELRTGRELWVYKDDDLTQHCMVASAVSDDRAVYLATPRFTLALGLSPQLRPETRLLWRERIGGCNCASPILVNGLLFMVSDTGVVSCVDTASGQKQWRHRLKGRYFASPVAAQDRIYFCNDSGLTTVIAAERSFRTIAENDLAERTQASFAIADGQLFIRTSNYLYCIGSSSKTATSTTTDATTARR